jgi:hypothetical protein
MRLGSRVADDDDRMRDYLNHLGKSSLLAVTHPLLVQRYPQHVKDTTDTNYDTEGSRSQDSESTPSRISLRGTDIGLSNRHILSTEYVDLHMMGEINDRFSPDIVTMEFDGEWSQFDETVRWLKTRPTELSNFLKDNASGVAQNVGSASLVKLMNEVAWKLKGHGERGNLFVFHKLFHEASHEYDDQKHKSDILVLQKAVTEFDSKVDAVSFKDIASIGQRRKHRKADFRTAFGPSRSRDLKSLPLIRMLRGVVSVLCKLLWRLSALATDSTPTD